MFDKSTRKDGTFSRSDFTYDHERDLYVCPAGKELMHCRRQFQQPRTGVDAKGLVRCRATKQDCGSCALKERCCPQARCPQDPAERRCCPVPPGAANRRATSKTLAAVQCGTKTIPWR